MFNQRSLVSEAAPGFSASQLLWGLGVCVCKHTFHTPPYIVSVIHIHRWPSFALCFFIITGSVLHIYSFHLKKKIQNKDWIAHLLSLKLTCSIPPLFPQPLFKGWDIRVSVSLCQKSTWGSRALLGQGKDRLGGRRADLSADSEFQDFFLPPLTDIIMAQTS